MNLTTITTSRSINIKEQSLFVAWAEVGVKAEEYIIFFGGGGGAGRSRGFREGAEVELVNASRV